LALLKKNQRFIFISSQAPAGPSTSFTPIDEQAQPHPLTCYGKNKLVAENYIREWGKKNNNN
jgi:nucleoside-diphosphate-sugar epimerase